MHSNQDMKKIWFKGLLAVYLVVLTWLVLFKLKFNIASVLHYHHRSLNLIPFAAPSIVRGKINYGEIIDNCLFFIPFGLLLSVNFKKTGFVRKLVFILAFSLAAEMIQYIFAIGASDITDVITNTLGGFLGLKLYDIGNKFISTKKLDIVIILAGSFLFLLSISIYLSHFVRGS